MANASAREIAYQRIRDQIIHLELKPGEPLNDNELAKQMGMSRTPVREAVLMLSLANLVVVRPQSGTFVTPIDVKTVEIEQFSRFALEKEVLQEVCRCRRPEVERLYDENIQLYQFYMHSQAKDREERLLATDDDFHRIAFQAAGREEHFDRMLGTLQQVSRYRLLSLQAIEEKTVSDDHQKIAQAVIRQDAEEAGRVLEIHLNRYQEDLRMIRKLFPQYF